MSTDDPPDLDPQLAEAVRRAYVQPVDEVTARRHVSAIAAAASAAGEAVRRPARSRRRTWQAAAAGVTATLLLPVGLAVAGVSLPQAVSRPYRSIGVPLPHQPRQDATPTTPRVDPRAPAMPGTSTAPPPPRDADRPGTVPADRPQAGQKNGAAGSLTRPKAKQGQSNSSSPGNSSGSQGNVKKPSPGARGVAGTKTQSSPRKPPATTKPERKQKRPKVKSTLGQGRAPTLTPPSEKPRPLGPGAPPGVARKPLP